MRVTPIAMFLVALAASAVAQVPADPVSYTGAIVSFGDADVTLRLDGGKDVRVAMAPGWTVVTTRPINAAAIKPGEYVATANTSMGTDAGRATEVRVLEPGYLPEYGSHPTGRRPDLIMTHALVRAVSSTGEGLVMEVTYPSGSRRITVPQDAPLTGYDLHPRTVLKAGTVVTAVTRPGGDAIWRAARLQMAKP